ncbi:DUF6492 family protein [Sinorhizobium sp. BG8]|uniref:DUF6492 family protein n=1 Tax=Sinorhizobium sp. BG8 TaxID=2613773 RepID=UPI00193E4B4B|nr:DUF6492 family protein [Sinorhizobium sp. BG8]QRM53202.1 hypothetical protein F3Y30_00440 [Sinorhizobium sp. BG8]
MPTLSVVTPSYRPDIELCRDLHSSLKAFAPPHTNHCVIVPKSDRAIFAGIGDVHKVDEFLPASFRSVPGNLWINLRRPIPPVRGWIVQQLIKIEAVARSKADVVLLVDSDMVFIRPFSAHTFYRDGKTRFYRAVDAVHAGLPRHILWHRVARQLLGLPPSDRIPLHDYICWPMAWDPTVVRAMLSRVEGVAGTAWQTAIASQLHFSEGILYGVYVDEVLGGAPYSEGTMLSIAYSDEIPFDQVGAEKFLSSVSPDDIAVMISAKSGTGLEERRRALAAIGGR